LNYPYRAVLGTQSAADTISRVNADNAVIITPNGFGRADIHAIGIFTLIADHWYMVEVFISGEDQKTGPPGVISFDQVHAAYQLADAAACTFVKVCVNKEFDGFLPIKFSVFKNANITYYVLCKLFFLLLLKKGYAMAWITYHILDTM
jgi:hypothetical protein